MRTRYATVAVEKATSLVIVGHLHQKEKVKETKVEAKVTRRVKAKEKEIYRNAKNGENLDIRKVLVENFTLNCGDRRGRKSRRWQKKRWRRTTVTWVAWLWETGGLCHLRKTALLGRNVSNA